MAWFSFVKRRQVSPGAQAYALSGFRAVAMSDVGPATKTLQRFKVFQPPQMAQGLNVPLGGLGGITTGQIVGQPLFDLETDGVSSGTLF